MVLLATQDFFVLVVIVYSFAACSHAEHLTFYAKIKYICGDTHMYVRTYVHLGLP